VTGVAGRIHDDLEVHQVLLRRRPHEPHRSALGALG
jgi:hypothetical protein